LQCLVSTTGLFVGFSLSGCNNHSQIFVDKVGFWEYKLFHSHGFRSSEVLPIEKEEETRQDIIKVRKKERKQIRAIGKEAICTANFGHFN
jgi:hypothetical protein